MATFQRSTVVLEDQFEQSPGSKGSCIDADLQPARAYAPKINAAFAAHGSPLTKHSEILRKRPPRTLKGLPAMVRRHLEIMAFESPPNACAFKYIPSAAQFLTAAKDLFLAILDAFRRRILHRNISADNILVANNQLFMVDWDIRRLFPFAGGRGTVAGTLETMSVAGLANRDPLPHDDFESAVYVLLKVLTQTFVAPVDQQREWAATLWRYHWDSPNVHPLMLKDIRLSMWIARSNEGSVIDSTVQMFCRAGHTTRAQLILALLSLPLPVKCRLFDSSAVYDRQYDAILLSLQALVDKAVAAVDSVDANSLIWSGAGVVDAGQEGI
ncbi:hypothetical protein GGX14DRAFT_567147 [Mycena pura]|uniref:Fungal-type protein kinase domain-containing protein n=1 Tax=Mycena pura TaxID=153505 RepID=A0AAD6VEW1_9AGAR|nr:hypothetical protein GGX14DRAFT_567147 [Mycena pura]